VHTQRSVAEKAERQPPKRQKVNRAQNSQRQGAQSEKCSQAWVVCWALARVFPSSQFFSADITHSDSVLGIFEACCAFKPPPAKRDTLDLQLLRSADGLVLVSEIFEQFLVFGRVFPLLQNLNDEIEAADTVPPDFKQRLIATKPEFGPVWSLCEAAAQRESKIRVCQNWLRS
jgi:hypothetical protein